MSLRALWVFALLVLLSIGVVGAQNAGPEACPALVELALSELGDNCGEMDRNSACYGYNQVDSTFMVEVDEDFFNDPADRAELVQLTSVRTAPLDVDLERWGIAVMNVQANVPGTVPGQAVTFLLLGDSEVTNAVDPADVTAEVEPIEVVTIYSSNIRSGPGLENNVVTGASPGTPLLADAISEDGQWVRVYHNDRLAWISLEVLGPAEGLDALPLADDPVVSPMQAFYFTTGVGQPQCTEAPDVIAIRSPEGIEVALNANGADFTIGSTIALKDLGNGMFTITVIEGSLTTEDGQVVEAGQTIVGVVDEDGNWVEWLEIRDATEEELGYAPTINLALEELGLVDEEPEIIFTGQGAIDVGGGACTGFGPTSPLGGLAYGVNLFYWDAAPGADAYRVIATNLNTRQTQSTDVAAPTTTTTLSLTRETIGDGYNFAWEVQALRNGRVICGGQVVTIQREAPPVAGGPGMTASWSCTGVMQTNIVYSGVPAGNTVDFNYTYNNGFGFVGGSSTGNPGPSGATGALGSKFDTQYSGTATAQPSGLTVPITPGVSPAC
jgi:hypothetical protein